MPTQSIPKMVNFGTGQIVKFPRSESEIKLKKTDSVVTHFTARYVGIGDSKELLALGKSQSVEDISALDMNGSELIDDASADASKLQSLKQAFTKLQYSILASLPSFLYDASQQLSNALQKNDLQTASLWIKAGVDTTHLLLDAACNDDAPQVLALMTARKLAGQYFNPVLDAQGQTLAHYIKEQMMVSPKQAKALEKALVSSATSVLEQAVQLNQTDTVQSLLRNVDTLDRAFVKTIAANVAREDAEFSLSDMKTFLDALEGADLYVNPCAINKDTLLSLATAAGEQAKEIKDLIIDKLVRADQKSPETLETALKNTDASGLQAIFAARLTEGRHIDLSGILQGPHPWLAPDPWVIVEPAMAAISQTIARQGSVNESVHFHLESLLGHENEEVRQLTIEGCIDADRNNSVLFEHLQRTGHTETSQALLIARLQEGRPLEGGGKIAPSDLAHAAMTALIELPYGTAPHSALASLLGEFLPHKSADIRSTVLDLAVNADRSNGILFDHAVHAGDSGLMQKIFVGRLQDGRPIDLTAASSQLQLFQLAQGAMAAILEVSELDRSGVDGNVLNTLIRELSQHESQEVKDTTIDTLLQADRSNNFLLAHAIHHENQELGRVLIASRLKENRPIDLSVVSTPMQRKLLSDWASATFYSEMRPNLSDVHQNVT